MEIKVFKWWYAIGINIYTDLLGEKKVTLIAMTEDKKLLNHYEAPIRVENEVAVVDCGEYGDGIYLLPLQWLATDTERITRWWLTINQHYDAQEIPGIITAVESNRAVMLPQGSQLWGASSRSTASFVNRTVGAIIPIGDGTCIAWEGGGKCSIISDREADDMTIRVNCRRILGNA